MKVKNTKWRNFSLLAMSVVLLSACTSTATSDPTISGESGQISFVGDPLYDFGDINIDGGIVDYTFELKNDSDSPLLISTASTSCMCTTALIELSGEKYSPLFGMHGAEDWNEVVQPGEEFEVEVAFDPMAHGPEAVGPISRSVFILSTSKENDSAAVRDDSEEYAVTRLDFSGDVMFATDYTEKYPVEIFAFAETSFDFGTVKQSAGIISHEFEFTYNGEADVVVDGVPTSCACTTAAIDKDSYSKGDTGILTVSFDPNLHEEPTGRFFKSINILTTPELEKLPEVKIWVEMDLDLGPEAYKLQSHTD